MDDNKNNEKNVMSKYRKYLPIGTVILLKEGKKRLMITGFCPVANEDGKKKMYDYTGVIYPEGVVSASQMLLFNHAQIEKIFHMGMYKDEEEKAFKQNLIKTVKALGKEKK